MTTLADLATPHQPNWCPGCGNYTIWAAFKNAAVEQGWDNTNTAMTADIGCNGHIVNFTKINSVEGLHGRALPVAEGIKMANHKLNVFAFIGDGGCMGEGGNHFIHACRRNHDMTVVLHDNELYSLTTGQTSPTTQQGYPTKSTPFGNPDKPFSPAALAIASGATFVARVYSGDIKNLKEIFIKANKHKGIAIIDILQPCVTFHKVCTHTFYQQNTTPLPDDWDKTDKAAAFMKAMEFGENDIPVGIFYEVEKPTNESHFPQLKQTPIVKIPIKRDGLKEVLKSYS